MHYASLPRLTFRDRNSLLESNNTLKNSSKDSKRLNIELFKAKNRKV